MRALIFAVIMGLVAPAWAGVLPITGKYCSDAHDGLAETVLDADGIGDEEDLWFANVVRSGPDWWDVAYKPSDYVDPGTVDHITLSADKLTLTITAPANAPLVLHRCN